MNISRAKISNAFYDAYHKTDFSLSMQKAFSQAQ